MSGSVYYANIACDLPRDTKMLMAGWQARAVYVEGVLFARENLTDGELLRVALPLWMPDMHVRTRAKHLDRLAELGALEVIEGGWRYPDRVWKRWNPSRAEVEEKRAAERERKAEWRRKKRDEASDDDGSHRNDRKRVRDEPRNNVVGIHEPPASRIVSAECPNGTPTSVPYVSQACPRESETETETETEISPQVPIKDTNGTPHDGNIEATISHLSERFRA